MPKRILDDSFLDSRSMEVLSPRAQDAFPRFILLADDFGCFEVNVVKLRAIGWSRRPDVSDEDVAAWITEYAERQAVDPETGKKLAPVLMLWTHVGRRYAHLTGWSGPHGQKKRDEYGPGKPHGSKRHTPAPPADLLAAVLAGEVRAVDGKPPGTDRETTGNPESENASNSVPARELTGKLPGNDREIAGKRTFPAPAVPVAVADADADAKVAAKPGGSPPPKQTDPRFAPLRAAWEREFTAARHEPYRWEGPKDARGIHRLIAVDPAEFTARARRGLAAAGYARCSTVAALAAKWNDLAGSGPAPPAPKGRQQGTDFTARPPWEAKA